MAAGTASYRWNMHQVIDNLLTVVTGMESLKLGKMVTDLDPGIFASTRSAATARLGATSGRKFGCRFLDPDLDLVSIDSVAHCH